MVRTERLDYTVSSVNSFNAQRLGILLKGCDHVSLNRGVAIFLPPRFKRAGRKGGKIEKPGGDLAFTRSGHELVDAQAGAACPPLSDPYADKWRPCANETKRGEFQSLKLSPVIFRAPKLSTNFSAEMFIQRSLTSSPRFRIPSSPLFPRKSLIASVFSPCFIFFHAFLRVLGRRFVIIQGEGEFFARVLWRWMNVTGSLFHWRKEGRREEE